MITLFLIVPCLMSAVVKIPTKIGRINPKLFVRENVLNIMLFPEIKDSSVSSDNLLTKIYSTTVKIGRPIQIPSKT